MSQEITALSFAVQGWSLPKIFVKLAHMAIYATPSLAEHLRQALEDQTHDDIRARGGPSSPTLTKLLKADGSPVSLATARRLEAALDWPPGTVAAVSRGEPPPTRKMLDREQVTQAAEIVRADLNADLAHFTDRELLQEIERRMLLMAAELQVDGHSRLTWAVDDDGQTILTSIPGED